MKNCKKYLLISLIPVCWSSLYIFLEYTSQWHIWGINKLSPTFPDLHVLLSAIDAYFLGYDVYKENPLGYYNIPHVYSKLWFLFHYLGWSDTHRIIIGLLILICFSFAVSSLLKDHLIYSIPFVFSPAILMAIERCNNDIIIFLLLLIVGKLSLSKNKSQLIISHLLLFIAIGFKVLSSRIRNYISM